MLRRAEISPDLLAQPLARVSSAAYGTLWHHIAQETDDEFFGLDSRKMKAGSFTLLCHAVIHAETLERALRRALRFFRITLDDIEGHLVRDGDSATLRLDDIGPAGQLPPPKRAFAYGTLLLMLHGLACWLVGRRIPLDSVCFRCAEPTFAAEWRVLFTRNLAFGQDSTAITFPAEFLDLATIQNERSMKLFLRSAPANFLVKYKNSTTMAARVRRTLRDVPPIDWPDFDGIARRFRLSPATLRRRLSDEGQTYREIIDELRHDLAISLLSDTACTVGDIADRLGFSEPSAFYRAFRKWTGSSPSEYRMRS